METCLEQRAWHKSYPAGMPHEVVLEEGLTLPSYFERYCARYEERVAYSLADIKLSYGELARRATAFAAYLAASGLGMGDRVAIMLPNSLVYPIALHGILRAGMTVVSVNPLYTARELLHQLQDSGAVAILASEELLDLIRPLAPACDLKLIISASQDELVPLHQDWILQRTAADQPGTSNFSNAVISAASLPPAQHWVDESDIAFLQYTGGTTGLSKGAALTHKNMLACMANQSRWLAEALLDGTQCVMSLPLYHIYPLNVALMLIGCGGTMRLVANARDLEQLLTELRREPFHVLPGVNTLFNSLVASGQLRASDFRDTRLVIGAGASLQKSVAERWTAETGCPVREGYGLTECSPSVAFNSLSGPSRIGSVGLPIPSTDVRLVDLSGRNVGVGEAGEICVKGPQVFSGYWRRPAETAEVMTPDGWLRTGDIGVMDEDGYLSIVDRLKDMILVSGFNVYPTELEGVVAEIPEVLECACIGVPDDRSGEVPHMFIVRRDPELTAERVEAHCRANLTGYKIPRHFTFLEVLPKSNVGKILRRELRSAKGTKTSAIS